MVPLGVGDVYRPFSIKWVFIVILADFHHAFLRDNANGLLQANSASVVVRSFLDSGCRCLESSTERGWGGGLDKFLYGEAPSGGSNPLYLANFYQNGTPFIYLEQN